MSRFPRPVRANPPATRRPRMRAVNIRGRLKVVAGCLIVAGLLLVGRAAELQVLHHDFYQRQGNARFIRTVEIPASRGMITDRNGEPLAISSPVDSIWVNPTLLWAHVAAHEADRALAARQAEQETAGETVLDKDRPRQWKHADCIADLARAVEVTPALLRERLEQRANREFIWLRRHVDPDQADAIRELGIPGVASQREFRRFYPFAEAAAHVLGFTNIDDKGQEGLELAYDQWLTGKPGAKRVIRDGEGRQIASVDLVRAAEPGKPLTLSIDRRLQHLAYRELRRALVDNQAEAGSVVVLDVATGEVLAMVSQPGFNPNALVESNAAARRNRAVTDVFEPGSTFKAFTVAAALELGNVTPNTPIETWPGTMQVAGHTVRDVRNFGTLTTTSLLTKSSNVAAAKLAQDMPAEHMYHLLRRFGFGEVTGIGFPGEQAGVLPSPRHWGTLVKATIAFGYGVSVTPLQLARAYAAIGNGGRLVRPSFLKGAPVQSEEVIDPALARSLLDMLETVTGPEGTGQRAALDGYRVAGKSGTSRKASSGGYERRYISLFVGLVPASQPRFSVVVMIDEPRSKDAAGNLVYYGGAVAAPVFHNVMEGALRLMDVPPDDLKTSLLVAAPGPAPGGVPLEAEAVPGMFGGTP